MKQAEEKLSDCLELCAGWFTNRVRQNRNLYSAAEMLEIINQVLDENRQPTETND